MATTAPPLVTLRAIDGKLHDLVEHVNAWKRGEQTEVNPLHCVELIDELLVLRFNHTPKEPA